MHGSQGYSGEGTVKTQKRESHSNSAQHSQIASLSRSEAATSNSQTFSFQNPTIANVQVQRRYSPQRTHFNDRSDSDLDRADVPLQQPSQLLPMQPHAHSNVQNGAYGASYSRNAPNAILLSNRSSKTTGYGTAVQHHSNTELLFTGKIGKLLVHRSKMGKSQQEILSHRQTIDEPGIIEYTNQPARTRSPLNLMVQTPLTSLRHYYKEQQQVLPGEDPVLGNRASFPNNANSMQH